MNQQIHIQNPVTKASYFGLSLKKTVLLTQVIILITVITGCNDKPDRQNNYGKMNQFEDQNIVITGFAQKGTFYREFESNGKLEAVRRAVLQYELDEEILTVEVKNGQRVEKGQVLSLLDATNQQFDYDRACRMVDKNQLALENLLIGMGYQLKDTLSVPENLLKVALTRSGYNDAMSEKSMAAIKLGKARITAPFAGIIAGVEAKPFNRSGQYKQFCTLIDDSFFEIDFPVLEIEASQLKENMPLIVIPYAFDNDTIQGWLSAVNPAVNEAGMVLATAAVKSKTGNLTDGMNVKVIVRDAVPGQIIIPKSAVTLRQEKKVVFVSINDTAHWRYVTIGQENSSYCTVTGDEIKPGEEVVVDGNFNLSHLSPVVKMK
jgi:RND family efflux transporter MFP subunit